MESADKTAQNDTKFVKVDHTVTVFLKPAKLSKCFVIFSGETKINR